MSVLKALVMTAAIGTATAAVSVIAAAACFLSVCVILAKMLYKLGKLIRASGL